MAKQVNLSFSATTNSVIAANPGLAFSVADLQAIQVGTLVTRGTIYGFEKGCIDWLRFDSDKDLTHMSIDGDVYSSRTSAGAERIANLNDFRQSLQNALSNGHRISFCYNKRTDVMSMLNVFRCGCECKG
ncbi:MAG: hypothetical protein AAFZ15_29135 [Bacteroidota bacterium]